MIHATNTCPCRCEVALREANPTEISDVTCLGCGCLCDDLVVRIDRGTIAEIKNPCVKGEQWFQQAGTRFDSPPAMIEGEPATLDEALSRAVQLLAAARAPIITGLSATTIETQRMAVALADRCRAIVDPAGSRASLAMRLAIQRVGIVSATLGEVKNRADVIVYWNCDPVTTHPRHLERYTTGARGRFAPEPRRLIVVTASHNATAEHADILLRLEPAAQFQAVSQMRRRLRGIARDDDRFDESMFQTLVQARYAAIFVDDSMSEWPGGRAMLESLLKLVRDLNLQGTNRFVLLPLGAPGNAAGAEAVLGWQAGGPCAVDFSRGFPRYLPDEAELEQRVVAGCADLVFTVAGPPPILHQQVPHILTGPNATLRQPSAHVAINTPVAGIETFGTVMRCDGVMLPLRALQNTSLPTDTAVLSCLLELLTP